MEYKDYYKILEVNRKAPQDEIKKSYRRLARKYHPDVSKETNAEQRFKDINEANEVLKDPEKRQAYDALGANWKSGQDFNPPPGWEFYGHTDVHHTGARAFSDFFENLFSQSFSESRFSQKTRGHTQDVGVVRISLEEAFHGTQRQLNLQEPVYESQGRVRLQNRTLTINIPKGAQDGQRLRIPADDSTLILTVEHLPHRLFRSEGRDLHLDLPITPWEAALGAKITIPTLTGQVTMNIPAGSQGGNKLRLKGKGLPGKTVGNQYVHLKIMAPPADTEKARALYKQMQEELPMDPRTDMHGAI